MLGCCQVVELECVWAVGGPDHSTKALELVQEVGIGGTEGISTSMVALVGAES
jgi:hypothetical protein